MHDIQQIFAVAQHCVIDAFSYRSGLRPLSL